MYGFTIDDIEEKPLLEPHVVGVIWMLFQGINSLAAQADCAKELSLNQIPNTNDALVLRTDFSDEAAWETICAAIQEPVGEFRAYVDFVSDSKNDGITAEQILSLILDASDHSFIFIVDQVALSHPENPILVVDLYAERGRTFRVIPSEMWSVENNLSIANLDFDEFADAADPDGILRGYSQI